MLRALRWTLGLLLAAVLAVAAVVVANTWRQGSRQIVVPTVKGIEVDPAGVGAALSEAVRARTVSGLENPRASAAAFDTLHAVLARRFPRVHATLSREVVGDHSLLFTWPGSDASARPIALLAHQDVVPVAPGTEGLWKQPPFSGAIVDGYVWGRGTWDDKGNLIAQLDAVERLLAAGFQPRRTIYLVFGHDEELGGRQGVAKVAALLQQRGVRLEFVLDEGLVIVSGVLPGLEPPAALIGIAEKGYVSVRLRAEATPGHSSMPPPPGQSAIAVLSAALQKVDARPVPGGVTGIASTMFDSLAPEMDGLNRYALTNLWLFGPMVERLLARSPSTNALLRTTTALTVVEAGNVDNVLPGVAEATVNFRLLPGDTRDGILAFVRETVADPRVSVAAVHGSAEPSRISSTDSDAYRLVERTLRELFPEVVVAPGLMIGGTDARHFEAIADQVLRFTPVRATPEDLKRFHGTDERLSLANLADLVRFYHRLLERAAGPPPAGLPTVARTAAAASRPASP